MGIPNNATNARKKKKSQNPETQFQLELNHCSKNNDLPAAISLYESALSQSLRLNQHHFNALLYLCSASVSDPSLRDSALNNGFRIFDRMVSAGVAPNEATITAVARLAAAKSDGDRAFALVKDIGKYNALPRLRTYDPALFCFVENSQPEKAYEVEEHMGSAGLSPEEPEIAALLRVSAEAAREDKVYEYLQKMRGSVRCVGESTAKVIESWFGGKKAAGVGGQSGGTAGLREAVLRSGGGWHGQGWIGEGDWVVRRGGVDSCARCRCCGERLLCVDIDDAETEKFAQAVVSLVLEREAKANFTEFQDWLDKHGAYEAIVDGANVGLYQQNFADGGFSVAQLDAVVKELYNKSRKWPLVVLHNKRSRALLENPSSRNLVNEWLDKGILYTTPNGSNDDWYWLYATVKLKCLLVTNDEMRDHIFELLGSSFFLKWKERHQVRYAFVKGNLQLQMPPPYSSVIQESEKGSWHVPLAAVDNIEESNRTWLCITRSRVYTAPDEALGVTETCQNSVHCDNRLMESSTLIPSTDTLDSNTDLSHASSEKIVAVTGKRKERSHSSS